MPRLSWPLLARPCRHGGHIRRTAAHHRPIDCILPRHGVFPVFFTKDLIALRVF
jgi:hypothetical protein